MKPYRFELYDKSNAAKTCEMDVYSANLIEALAGEHTLSLELDPYSGDPDSLEQYVGTSEDSALSIPLILPETFVRVTSTSTGVSEYFIVRSATKQRDGRKIIIKVECEHKKYAMLNRVVRISKSYSQINSTEFLNLVMPYASGFTITVNDIPTTEYRDVEIDYPTVMAALKYLCDNWTQWDGAIERRFYYLCDKDGNIQIKREDAIGTVADYPLIVDHNLTGITKSSNDASLVNRLYYTGLGNTIAYSGSQPIVNSVTSATTLIYFGGLIVDSMTFDLNDVGLNTDAVAWNSIVLIKLNSLAVGSWGSGSGSFTATVNVELLTSGDVLVGSSRVELGIVTYPNRVAGNPKWFAFRVGENTAVAKIKVTSVEVTLDGGANPQFVGMRSEGIEYELADNLDYVEDIASQGTYGLIEARLENREHPVVVNMLRDFKPVEGSAAVTRDATLSGTYTAGLNECFVKTGTVTTTENTTRAYIVNGTKSQHCVTTLKTKSGVRLATAPPRMAEGWTYNIILNLYVVAGKINIYVSLGYPWNSSATMLFQHQTAGIGLLQIRSETGFGLPSGTGASQFDIAINSDEPADWYVDSIAIAQSEEPIPFYKANSADSLKTEATRVLRLNSQPRTQYEVEMQDLAAIDEYYDTAIYNVGDDVLIRDNVANIQTSAKIYRAETDLFDPRKKRMTLADRSVGAAEMITLLSGAKILRGGL